MPYFDIVVNCTGSQIRKIDYVFANSEKEAVERCRKAFIKSTKEHPEVEFSFDLLSCNEVI